MRAAGAWLHRRLLAVLISGFFAGIVVAAVLPRSSERYALSGSLACGTAAALVIARRYGRPPGEV